MASFRRPAPSPAGRGISRFKAPSSSMTCHPDERASPRRDLTTRIKPPRQLREKSSFARTAHGRVRGTKLAMASFRRPAPSPAGRGISRFNAPSSSMTCHPDERASARRDLTTRIKPPPAIAGEILFCAHSARARARNEISNGVIPKTRAFTSGSRNLTIPITNCQLRAKC